MPVLFRTYYFIMAGLKRDAYAVKNIPAFKTVWLTGNPLPFGGYSYISINRFHN